MMRRRAAGCRRAGPAIAIADLGRQARTQAGHTRGKNQLLVVARAHGESPILLLDHVSSELAPQRNEHRFDHLACLAGQCLGPRPSRVRDRPGQRSAMSASCRYGEAATMLAASAPRLDPLPSGAQSPSVWTPTRWPSRLSTPAPELPTRVSRSV